jgi:hypothetical protein
MRPVDTPGDGAHTVHGQPWPTDDAVPLPHRLTTDAFYALIAAIIANAQAIGTSRALARVDEWIPICR